jgi:hypothetical protein
VLGPRFRPTVVTTGRPSSVARIIERRCLYTIGAFTLRFHHHGSAPIYGWNVDQ